MRRRNFRWMAVAGMMVAGWVMGTITVQPQSSPVVTALLTIDSGTAPFDSDNNPGNDANASNDVVRVNDFVLFKYEVAVDVANVTNVVITQPLPANYSAVLPSFCLTNGVTPPSAITGSRATGLTVICNIGNRTAGSTGLFSIPGKVDHTLGHGAVTVVDAGVVRSDQTPPVTFAGKTLTVSARPRLDIMLSQTPGYPMLAGGYVNGPHRFRSPDNVDGLVYNFPVLGSLPAGGRGAETLLPDLRFKLDLTQISPNARLFTWGTGEWADGACVPNRWSGTVSYYYNPYAYVRTSDGGLGTPAAYTLNAAGPATASAWNSGVFTCTPTADPRIIDARITGAELSGWHRPETPMHTPLTLPSDNAIVFSHTVRVWIPVQDILNAGGTLPISLRAYDMVATGLSGQVAQEPTTANNSRGFTINESLGGSYYHYLVRDYNNHSLITGTTQARSGDGIVSPGERFGSYQYWGNGAYISKARLNDVVLCQTFDNTIVNLGEIRPGVGAELIDHNPSGRHEPLPPFVVEYGTGSAINPARCDDDDSPDGWFTNMNDVPGGREAITRVRARGAYVTAPNETTTWVYISLRPRFVTRLNTTAGQRAAVRFAYKASNYFGGNWYTGTYNPETHDTWFGDRATVAEIAVRIDKVTNPSRTRQLAGLNIGYELRPTIISAAGAAGATRDVTIVDTLSEFYEFLPATASLAPTSITPLPDGKTELRWVLPNRTANVAIPPITYQVTVLPTTPDAQSTVNRVVINAPGEVAEEARRSKSVTMIIDNPSGFATDMRPRSTLILPNTVMEWEMVFANTGQVNFTSTDQIALLPNMVKPLNPATRFSGSLSLLSVSPSNGEVIYYTKAAPADVSIVPTHPSNDLTTGSTRWCTTLSGGACPANLAEVTGIRLIGPAFPKGAPARKVLLRIQTAGNVAGDLYSMNFGAAAGGMALPATSRTGTVYVASADLSARVTTPTETIVPGVAFPLTLRLENAGPHPATGITARLTLPAGISVQSNTGDGSYDPPTGLWSGLSIPVNGTVTQRLMLSSSVPLNAEALLEILTAEQADPDSTPGNALAGEDDQDTDPLVIAPDDGQILPPRGCTAGLASIDWDRVTGFANGVTSQSLDADGVPVTYDLTVSGGAVLSGGPNSATSYASNPLIGGRSITTHLTGLDTGGTGRIRMDLGAPGVGLTGLRLPLADVDSGERVRVSGWLGGLPVPVLADVGDGTRLEGGWVLGPFTAVDADDPIATPVFAFAGAVDRIEVEIGAQAGHTAAINGLGDLSFCAIDTGRDLALLPGHERQVLPGSVVILPHELVIGSSYGGGSVELAAQSMLDWQWTLHHDSDGDGQLTSADAVWVNGQALASGRHKLLLRGVVPQGTDTGKAELLNLSARLTKGTQMAVASVIDRITVHRPGEGIMQATKAMALDRNCDGHADAGSDGVFGDAHAAKPGECVIYRLSFANQGIAPVGGLEMRDATPAFTRFVGGSATVVGSLPAGLTLGSISAPGHQAEGAVIWPFHGQISPGAQATVQFRVQLIP